ncbi:DUF2214 family protein [Stutzerimonas nitrititolerans]|uniref:DUF2214 family protein n=1 Tax=Stutzerimonas nitrititolerans TaxID=2482751 RepID=A0ABX9V5J7_9GAMM|nr:DUF2214 family protein [Stutzerimonas nitrititolerans]RMI01197.1 DUF2214 family protein [Stutzerimonas nitrititolerans]
MIYAVAAYLHFLAIFLLVALLVLEHQLFRLPLTLERARSLFRIDLMFGVAAGLVLITGAARALRYGKGLDYYLHNSLFHAKIGLFVLVALLSIYPTVTFLGWRGALKAGELPKVTARTGRWVTLIIRIELLVLLSIPLLAASMARGFGVIV